MQSIRKASGGRTNMHSPRVKRNQTEGRTQMLNPVAAEILKRSREKYAKLLEEKRKPKLVKLEEKIASPPDLDRSREIQAQTTAQFHEEEREQIKAKVPLWLRNKRLYG